MTTRGELHHYPDTESPQAKSISWQELEHRFPHADTELASTILSQTLAQLETFLAVPQTPLFTVESARPLITKLVAEWSQWQSIWNEWATFSKALERAELQKWQQDPARATRSEVITPLGLMVRADEVLQYKHPELTLPAPLNETQIAQFRSFLARAEQLNNLIRPELIVRGSLPRAVETWLKGFQVPSGFLTPTEWTQELKQIPTHGQELSFLSYRNPEWANTPSIHDWCTQHQLELPPLPLSYETQTNMTRYFIARLAGASLEKANALNKKNEDTDKEEAAQPKKDFFSARFKDALPIPPVSFKLHIRGAAHPLTDPEMPEMLHRVAAYCKQKKLEWKVRLPDNINNIRNDDFTSSRWNGTFVTIYLSSPQELSLTQDDLKSAEKRAEKISELKRLLFQQWERILQMVQELESQLPPLKPDAVTHMITPSDLGLHTATAEQNGMKQGRVSFRFGTNGTDEELEQRWEELLQWSDNRDTRIWESAPQVLHEIWPILHGVAFREGVVIEPPSF